MADQGREGATEIRSRPVTTVPCAFCVEPVVVGQPVCDSCGEPVVPRAPPSKLQLLGAGLGVYAAIVLVGVLVGVRLGGGLSRRLALSSNASDASDASASPSAAASVSSIQPAASLASLASLSASSTAAPPRAPQRGGHLAGEVVGKMEIPADAVDVLALPHDRIAVARKAAVEVLDGKSGALAFTAPDLPAIRALYPVGDAVYGVGASRIAVIDPNSVRALKWIDLGAAPLGVAVSAGAPIALVPLADQSVAVIDTARHAEIERFRLDERVTAAGVDDRAGIAALATPDAAILIDPSRLAAAQPIRRVGIGEAPVSIAVSPSGALAAAALLSASVIARIDLTGLSGPSITRQKTCDEPTLIRFVLQPSVALVGCRAGRAIAFHDASTLAEIGRVDLGGPALALDVSPDGLQALVTIGPPAASVGVIDVVRRTLSRTSITDEVVSARYGRGGDGVPGAAFAPKARRVWVIR